MDSIVKILINQLYKGIKHLLDFVMGTMIPLIIIYLIAASGFIAQGKFTRSLTPSTDNTNHWISLQPLALGIIDFGHAELFMANHTDHYPVKYCQIGKKITIDNKLNKKNKD